MLIPTGPKFLSVAAMVMFGFFLISWSNFCLAIDRLCLMFVGVRVFRIDQLKHSIRVSISWGGSGARQIELILRAFDKESYESLGAPEKKVFNPMSCSKRERVMSISFGVIHRGVGMNFRPRPRIWLADVGRMLPVVSSWKVRFLTWVKYSDDIMSPNTF